MGKRLFLTAALLLLSCYEYQPPCKLSSPEFAMGVTGTLQRLDEQLVVVSPSLVSGLGGAEGSTEVPVAVRTYGIDGVLVDEFLFEILGPEEREDGASLSFPALSWSPAGLLAVRTVSEQQAEQHVDAALLLPVSLDITLYTESAAAKTILLEETQCQSCKPLPGVLFLTDRIVSVEMEKANTGSLGAPGTFFLLVHDLDGQLVARRQAGTVDGVGLLGAPRLLDSGRSDAFVWQEQGFLTFFNTDLEILVGPLSTPPQGAVASWSSGTLAWSRPSQTDGASFDVFQRAFGDTANEPTRVTTGTLLGHFAYGDKATTLVIENDALYAAVADEGGQKLGADLLWSDAGYTAGGVEALSENARLRIFVTTAMGLEHRELRCDL